MSRRHDPGHLQQLRRDGAVVDKLAGFRSGLYECFTGWCDSLFELCDAVLCSPSPVASVPSLSLEPVFRRGHGSLYKALARGDIDTDAYPYDLRTASSVGDVLIVGAGSGNDVSMALLQGADHVDAVEIDPRILEIAEDHHPDHPYEDDRVDVHVDDGRAYLERADEQWDLILLALPDSLTLVQGRGSVRLESYLFTREAVETYRDHLAPGGVFAMYNFFREEWLVDRYAGTLDEVFGVSPCVSQGGESVFAVLTVSADPDAISCEEGDRWIRAGDTRNR